MPTYESVRITELQARIDALDALAVAAGAADITQLVEVLAAIMPPPSAFADFRNSNAASLAAVL